MAILFYFILGVVALIMSILAWRLKENVYFIIGWICVGLMGVMAVVYWRWVEFLIREADIFILLLLASVLGFPIYFLIQSKLGGGNSESSNIDGSSAGGPVTEEYLDEIINSPEEEIDFEEDLDLK